MTYKVEFLTSATIINVDGEQNLLEAALSQNITVPYSCKRGTCGVCKAILLDGTVSVLEDSNNLSDKEVLLCQASALSDLIIKVEEVPELKDIEVKTFPTRVNKIERVASDVVVLELRLPQNEKFHFLPGQFIDLLYKDGIRRSYSIADFDEINNIIKLHIRNVEGGVFTQYIFDILKDNDLLRFEGPFGSFFVREKSTAPLIFMAGGTGYAPINAIIKILLDKGDLRDIHIYWGASSLAGFYSQQPERWMQEYRNVNYVPVLSGTSWDGRSGLVHHAVLDDFPDLSCYEVFACGSSEMINVAKEAFIMQGLPEKVFYFDAFV